MADTPRPNAEELWRAIVEVHNESKALFLFCEELEPRQFKTFLQPYNELRHAYEHAVRSKANELQLGKGSPSDIYQSESLGKCLAHEYRGFFDCADWLTVILRESVQETLQPYSNACIKSALPDYYSRDRIRVTELSESIAKIRGDKDIARKQESEDEVTPMAPAVLDEVRKYKEILSELRHIREKVWKALPALIDYQRKEKREGRGEWTGKWTAGIVSSLLTAAILCVAGLTWRALTTKNPPVAAPTDTAAPRTPAR
jgi:hypothetical protein